MKANDFDTPKPQDDRSRYEQGARDVVKGADPDHIARVRNLDPELLTKYVGYAWDRVNSGEYKLNRPNLEEDLRKWFREKWVRFGPDGKIRGDCARGSDKEGKPKCLPQSKAHALGKKGRASAASRKRRQDPNPERTGKAINVATKKKTNEASQINFKTALALAQDLHAAVQELRELMGAGQPIRALSQLRSEINSLNQQLQDLGYDYDPNNDRHLVPLTLDNRPQSKLREYPDTPMKMQDYLQQAEDLHARMLAASQAMNKQEFERLKKEREELDRRAGAGMIAERRCPECGGPAFGNLLLAEKKDACYHKVRSRYKVWPSAYASGALVQCRKKGAANWGNKSKNESVAEDKGELWRVLEPRNMGGHAARYYVVKGDGKTLKIWRSQSGAGDFVKRADAEAKAKELNQGVAEGLDDDESVLYHFAEVLADELGYDADEVAEGIVSEMTTPSGVEVYSFTDDDQTYYMGVLGRGRGSAIVSMSHAGGGQDNELEIYGPGENLKYVVKYGRTTPTLHTPDNKAIAKAQPGQDENDLVGLALDMLWGRMQQRFMEFAPAGSGGGTPPRGPRVPGGPGGGDDGAGEDPYGRPKPKHYARSSSYFEQFEADHFDKETFDKATGVFKGYWQEDDGSLVQIGYFKFDDPRRTGGDDPGMGWYYEPMDESLTEFISRDDDGDQGEEDDAMEAQFTVIIAGKPHTGTVRVFPGTTTDVEYYLNGKIYIKNDMQNVDDYDDFIENAAGYIQEIIQLKGDGHHFVEQGVAETYLQELSPELLKRASDAASAKYDIAADYGNRLPADTAQALMKHYGQQSARFAQGAKSAQQRDAEKATLSKIGMSDVARRKTGMTENDPWGPAGRFAGDVKTDISSTVEKFQPRVGQTVKVRDGNIKGLGEITRIKGDTASVWIHSYAREFEVPMSAISAAEVRESRSAIASAIAAAKL